MKPTKCPKCKGSGMSNWENSKGEQCKCHICNGTGKTPPQSKPKTSECEHEWDYHGCCLFCDAVKPQPTKQTSECRHGENPDECISCGGSKAKMELTEHCKPTEQTLDSLDILIEQWWLCSSNGNDPRKLAQAIREWMLAKIQGLMKGHGISGDTWVALADVKRALGLE